MYSTQAFIRSRTGFLPQRAINSFPEGACYGYEGRTDIFYSEHDRDFIVNMAGCKYTPSQKKCADSLAGVAIV